MVPSVPPKTVIVAISKNSFQPTAKSHHIAEFFTCLMEYLGKKDSVQVSWKLSENNFVIEPCALSTPDDNSAGSSPINSQPSTGLNTALLEHSPLCPFQNLPEKDAEKVLASEQAKQPVKVAVAVLLESSDGKLLMTRRAENMRSYPRAWVPPGGHLDPAESLIECGLRELHEETGLLFKETDLDIKIMCMWEAVFPPFVHFGLPRNHHLIVYLYGKTKNTSEQLQSSIKMNPEEVMAYAWFTPAVVQALKNADDLKMDVYEIDKSNPSSMKRTESNLSTMFGQASLMYSSPQVFSGTQQALNRWYKIKTDSVTSKI